MKKRRHSTILILVVITNALFAQNDSLISFTDLNFHGQFERDSYRNFIDGKENAFNLYLATDENVSADEAKQLLEKYESIFVELEESSIAGKKINKQIDLTVKVLSTTFLKRYAASEDFHALIADSSYNFLTESMLYALVFDKLEIPYKVMVSLSHVYLVANPGPQSIVIETENPASEIFSKSKEEKKAQIRSMKESGLINDAVLLEKSTDEIYAEQFDEVKKSSVDVFQGMQYFFSAKEKYDDSEYEEAFDLLKKAYIFFPDNKVELLMSSALSVLIERSRFEEVEDVDMISKYSRILGSDVGIVSQVFQRTINNNLELGKQNSFCDSMFTQLIFGIRDAKLSEEISFRYNMQMSLHLRDSIEAESYLKEAMRLRSNNNDLKKAMKIHYHNYFRKIYVKPTVLYAEVTRVQEEMKYDCITDVVTYYELLALLQLTESSANKENLSEAESYLEKFESDFDKKHLDQVMGEMLVEAYRTLAVKIFYKGNKTRAKEIVEKGLEYVPGNSYLKSAVY